MVCVNRYSMWVGLKGNKVHHFLSELLFLVFLYLFFLFPPLSSLVYSIIDAIKLLGGNRKTELTRWTKHSTYVTAVKCTTLQHFVINLCSFCFQRSGLLLVSRVVL